jgi:phenylpropionate dioxygenase-like ring-hydroxylating dioxygenase large terminal subunit
LFFGRNEESGLRCVYHGWKFDTSGACVDMPSEPAESNFKSKVRVRAYPTHESGGIVWTYMGPPENQPGFADFGTESMLQGEWSARKVLTHCNWIQGLEGNLDSAHASCTADAAAGFTASGSARRRLVRQARLSADARCRYRRQENPTLEVQDTWYGFAMPDCKTPAGTRTPALRTSSCPFTRTCRTRTDL